MILLLTILSALLAGAPEIHIQPRFASSSDIKWSYKDTSHWPKECAGKKQSPINIEVQKARKDSGSIGLTLTSGQEQKGTIKNNGHSAEITIPVSSFKLTIDGSTTKYNFDRLHFHWGKTDNRGSEHTLSGQTFAAEMHIVSWNTKYDSLETAQKKTDGLAVLGTLFKLSKKPNPTLTPIVNALGKIKAVKSSSKVAFDLSKIIPKEKNDFYTYSGSLTTPPCSEVVTWVIFEKPVTISDDQLEAFRHLQDGKGQQLLSNWREVQPVNTRNVKHAHGG